MSLFHGFPSQMDGAGRFWRIFDRGDPVKFCEFEKNERFEWDIWLWIATSEIVGHTSLLRLIWKVKLYFKEKKLILGAKSLFCFMPLFPHIFQNHQISASKVTYDPRHFHNFRRIWNMRFYAQHNKLVANLEHEILQFSLWIHVLSCPALQNCFHPRAWKQMYFFNISRVSMPGITQFLSS